MNKEELIEFFIEQLGDNKILGRVMSIEQVRDKLAQTIKAVSVMTFETKQAYTEVYEILQYLPRAYVEKIPPKIIKLFESIKLDVKECI